MLPSVSCSFTSGMAAMAACALPDVRVSARLSLSDMEKNTSIVLISDTVVSELLALTKAPTLKGKLPTTPAEGLFTEHQLRVSLADASEASA